MATLLHNVPEGMAMAGPMVAAGITSLKVASAAIVAGLPEGIGALLGALIGRVSTATLAISSSFAAGAMLYIVFDELIPEAQSHAEGHSGPRRVLSRCRNGYALLLMIKVTIKSSITARM